MKISPILITTLAASLGFAQVQVTGTRPNTEGEYAPKLTIKNTSATQTFVGFKLYAYFENEDRNAQHYFVDFTGSGAFVQPMGTKTPGSPYVYRVEMDFADVVLQPNQELPPLTYFGVYKHPAYPGSNWFGFYNDRRFNDIVIESKTGRLLHSRHPNFKSRVGTPGFPCSISNVGADMYFVLDTEDNNNESGVTGDNGFRGVLKHNSKKDIRFHYCIEDFRDFKPVPYDYVVLRLDENCPSGTHPFARIHDTEDKNNKNYVNGHIRPSVIDKDHARLEYCFVPLTPNAPYEFPLEGNNYEFFANRSSTNTVAIATAHIDDEDKNNENGWDFYGMDDENSTNYKPGIVNRIKSIVYANGKDTDYKLIKRKNSLKKRAEVASADAPVPTDNMVVVNKPAAAALRGFDHSSVSFEIKTAGNAKVTITNAKGAVVANIAKENLEPGIHTVQWHSGIVPSGLYILKIEHNGKTTANSVILK